MNEYLSKAQVTLEDKFFLEEDKILIEKLRQMEKMGRTIEEYTRVTGITNPTVLKKLYELQIPIEVAASLKVVPLVEVAWADGIVDEEEKRVILDKAEKLGIKKNSVEFEILERWVEHRPSKELLVAWKAYVHGLCSEMTPKEQVELKVELLKHIEKIARASGGVQVFGVNAIDRISKKERAVIEELKTAFVS